MKTYALMLCVLAQVVVSALPAAARANYGRSADMFYDRGWIYDRPWVRSDGVRGGDMFKAVPPLYSKDADMLRKYNKRNIYGRDDMLPHITTQQIPLHTLVIDPIQGPYNVR